MAGVILETLNFRKLCVFGLIMVATHLAFFLIGGLISPSPNNSDQILLSKCIIPLGHVSEWHYVRPVSNITCKNVIQAINFDNEDDEEYPLNFTANELVFIAQFPHPRDGYRLTMTRWFQQILAVLMLEIESKHGVNVDEDAVITFDLRLGYRNAGDPEHVWHHLAQSTEARPLKCTLPPEAKPTDDIGSMNRGGVYYNCDIIPLFTLASCHHEEYLLNLRIPVDANRTINQKIGAIRDVWMVEIHQNGGFTKVWFSLKTFVFPITFLALMFFTTRVRELDRKSNILEQAIFILGVALTFLNCPVEWISLVVNASFWLILSDVRQGFFYAVLACFWLVFTGEHMMDGSGRHSPSSSLFAGIKPVYWPRLLLVVGCCSALFIFELAERGVQIGNPFYSIWSHPVAARLGIASIVLGSLCALAYLVYLTYLVVSALVQVLAKRRLLACMPGEQRHYYTGVIYRFTVLLVYTLVCAALTVIFFLLSHATEDQWSWGERTLEYNSAFITGVYGMWNIYVVAVLCLYAPSHKFRSRSGQELYNRLVSTVATSSSVAGAADARADGQSGDDYPSDSIRLVPRQATDKASCLELLRKTALE